MNHELTQANISRTTIGEPRNRGAIVSKVTLSRHGEVLAAERAYDDVYLENTYVGPAATEANSTRGFGRFCSGSIAGPPDGFDRWIYFANEEAGAPATFSPLGGLSVAIFDNEAHGLPKLGHFPWENSLVQPNKHGNQTVIMGMEDGPADLGAASINSQVYMYVGTKVHSSASVLRRNGLDNGTLYVLAPVNAAQSSEDVFRTGTIQVRWVEIPGAENLSEAQLEAASDARGAFRFARPEDGAFNKENPDHYVFVTTGGAPTLPGSTPANDLGRVYSLNLNSDNVLGSASLKVEVNADNVIAAGGDTAISPDNVDTSDDYLMINEDGTAQSRVRDGREEPRRLDLAVQIGGPLRQWLLPPHGSASSTHPVGTGLPSAQGSQRRAGRHRRVFASRPGQLHLHVQPAVAPRPGPGRAHRGRCAAPQT